MGQDEERSIAGMASGTPTLGEPHQHLTMLYRVMQMYALTGLNELRSNIFFSIGHIEFLTSSLFTTYSTPTT